MPLILKGVARQAATVLPMVLVTPYGPILRTPRERSVSAAFTTLELEAPPDPAIRPVRTFETSPTSRPASAIACFIDIKAKAAASPMNRKTLRSICSLRSMWQLPDTWLRRPISLKVSLATMPDRPFLSASRTSSLLLPIHETTPSPVMTARRMRSPRSRRWR